MLANSIMIISDSDGEELVRLAREAVSKYLSDSTIIQKDMHSSALAEKAGVFVTLNYLTRTREEHLRGCIGFPLPEKSLYHSVVEAAIASATQDPRFPPVDMHELRNILFEISVLTPPVEIKAKSPADRRNEIKVGRDGLILRWTYGSGLLLPQVPIEQKWDIDEYLANICYKAGAPPDTWLIPDSKLYRFEAIIFKEIEPGGKVVRVNIA